LIDPHAASTLQTTLRAWTRVLCVALWFWACAASAEDVLEVPPSCGSQAELEREIAALREDAGEQGSRPTVKLTTEGEVYVLEVRLPDGARTLRNRDCRALFRAGIVIAALGQAGAAGLAGRATAPSAVGAPQRASAARSGERDSTATGRRRSHVRGVADASSRPRALRNGHALAAAGFVYGAVPAWSAALAAGARLSRGRWGGRMLLGYVAPRTHHQGGDGVRVDGASASLSFELGLSARAWMLLGTDLFLLRGSGFDVLRARTELVLQPTLHLGVGVLILQRGRFGLELGARALWAPRRSSFNARGHGSVYEPEQFGVLSELSFRVQFL
jgi:hypothetical protein